MNIIEALRHIFSVLFGLLTGLSMPSMPPAVAQVLDAGIWTARGIVLVLALSALVSVARIVTAVRDIGRMLFGRRLAK